jgi:hypothetical protein
MIKLSDKLFSKDIDQQPIRKGFGDGMMILGKENAKVIALCCDLTDSKARRICQSLSRIDLSKSVSPNKIWQDWVPGLRTKDLFHSLLLTRLFLQAAIGTRFACRFAIPKTMSKLLVQPRGYFRRS